VKKTILWFLVVAVVISMVGVFSLVGCKEEAPAEEEVVEEVAEEEVAEEAEDIKVVYTTMNLASPYWVEISTGIEDGAAELGWEATIHDAKGDVAGQLSAIENFITQGYDVIFLSALDRNAVADVVAKAMDAGIPVITEATIVEGTAAHLGPVEEDMGRALGEAAGQWLAANFEGTAKLATYFVQEDPNTLRREAAIREGVEKFYPDVEWVASLPSITPEDGLNNFENLLQSNPDINGVLSCCDDGVIGSHQAAVAANLDLSNMIFGGINAIPQALEVMKQEKDADYGAYQVTVDIVPYETGKILIDVAKRILDGENMTGREPAIPVKAVTWENIDEYFE